jgi:hypothetical protein
VIKSPRPSPSQAAELKVSVRGSATVRAEVQEREDGALVVHYTAPMSGEYKVRGYLFTRQLPQLDASLARVQCPATCFSGCLQGHMNMRLNGRAGGVARVR